MSDFFNALLAAKIAGGGDITEQLVAGTNIEIEETAEGKAKISASGEVSSEDTYAREEIQGILDGTTLDSFGDVETALSGKADTTDIPTVPITAIQKNGTGITPVSGTVNITVPTSAADVLALPDTTKYAAALSLTINSSTFVMTGQLKDQNGDNLGTAQTIDLPLESVVVGGSYNSQTKKVVLTLQNGNTIEFSVADLVSGLQTELSASNKLNPAYINYDSTHRAVSDTEKSTWNSKQNAIDSSHKLSADLIDDTNATNKFATAAELEQIETNKNNILILADKGFKNFLNIPDFSGAYFGMTVSCVNGEISISGTAIATGSLYLTGAVHDSPDSSMYIYDTFPEKITLTGAPTTDNKDRIIVGLMKGNTYVYGFSTQTPEQDLSQYDYDNYYVYIPIASGVQYSGTWKPMLYTQGLDDNFEPYAKSNSDLTIDTKIIDITNTFTAATGFTRDGNSRVYKQGNHIFGNLIIKSNSAYTSAAATVLSDATYKPKNSITNVAFFDDTSWTVNSLGSYYFGSNGKMSCRCNTGTTDTYAHINLDYVIS